MHEIEIDFLIEQELIGESHHAFPVPRDDAVGAVGPVAADVIGDAEEVEGGFRGEVRLSDGVGVGGFIPLGLKVDKERGATKAMNQCSSKGNLSMRFLN